MANALQNFKILVADPDPYLSGIFRDMLVNMGFPNIQLTQSGKEALEILKEAQYDFVVTDWNLKDVDGLEMSHYIRSDAATPNPTLPVIMLTGRAEQSDVITARDMGINEFVVKPFSAKTVFNRLERIVEYPRYFVVTNKFIGPDRRHRDQPSPVGYERRQSRIIPQKRPWDAVHEVSAGLNNKIWLPDFALKQKLGHNVTLDSLVTPTVIEQAQHAIDNIAIDSLQWIKNDLLELQYIFKALQEQVPPRRLVAEMGEVALVISARAGTFGYSGASEIAYMLYIFCRKHLRVDNANHHTIVAKHIDVLRLIFAARIDGKGSEVSNIISELKMLTRKYL